MASEEPPVWTAESMLADRRVFTVSARVWDLTEGLDETAKRWVASKC
jgi:hypothetical protein